MTKTYKSEALAAIHKTASSLHDTNAISKATMREYEELCLTPVKKLSSEESVESDNSSFRGSPVQLKDPSEPVWEFYESSFKCENNT